MMTRLKNKENNKNYKETSIQVHLNGFSFCSLNTTNNEVLFFKKITFKKKLNPTEALQQIKLFYAKEIQLQQPVDKFTLIFSNNLYTLVPHIFFKEENAPDYLKYNAKILKTDFVSHDIIAKPQIANVYIPYMNISNYFFDLYGEFEYKHAISIFLEGILGFENSEGIKIYINNYNNHFDLAVVENGKLLLCNTFFYETKEDFLYYILFTTEQLKLKNDDFELILLGEIEKDSELFKICYTYIEDVNVHKEKQDFAFSKQEKPAHFHHEFILMKSLLNEDRFRNS